MLIIECVYVHSPLPSLTGLPQRTWGHSAAPYHACQSIHVWLQVCYFKLPISGGCILDCFNCLKLRTRISKWPKLTKDPMSSWFYHGFIHGFSLFFPQLDTSEDGAGLVISAIHAIDPCTAPSSSWGKQPPSRDGQRHQPGYCRSPAWWPGAKT